MDSKTSARRGPCDERWIRQGYVSGLLSAGTLVWREGLANWVPLRNALDLSAPPSGEGRVPLPPGLCAWMLFDGICTILVSLPFLLLLPWNIPLLVAGIALLGARSRLRRIPFVPEEMIPFLLRLRTVFCAVGWVFIVILVLVILFFLAGAHASLESFAGLVALPPGWFAPAP